MVHMGKRIMDICNEKKISMGELSQKSGVSITTIKKIVDGELLNPRVSTILNICDGMGVAYSEFFKGI